MSQKLSGMSRNRFKIMPLGSRTATAGTTTNWALPENALIDTASIRVHAFCSTTGASAGAGPTVVYECNTLCAVLKNAGGTSKDRDSSYDRSVCHGAIDGSADANEDVSVIIDFPAGALSQNSTRFWPTQALGSLTIECVWADNNVLVAKEHGGEVGVADLTADAKTAAANINISGPNTKLRIYI
eukprot:3950333-Prymnesium_polylepis.1